MEDQSDQHPARADHENTLKNHKEIFVLTIEPHAEFYSHLG